MTTLPFSATTPVSVGRVGLRARDAAQLAAFYKDLLGLVETRRSGDTIALSAGGRELLEIEGSAALKPDDPHSAGLYHTAFLFPERADLARWTQYAIGRQFRIDGASDHDVSEAIYLTDPEGNGIEIYADRPRSSWTFDDGQVRMRTERLDFGALARELEGKPSEWSGAPDGTVVGHVHFRVGAVGDAEQWWNSEMGFDTMRHRGDVAVFLSSGGYHHHVGANIWHSKGAGPRPAGTAGLAFVEFRAKDQASEREITDPWGNVIRIIPA